VPVPGLLTVWFTKNPKSMSVEPKVMGTFEATLLPLLSGLPSLSIVLSEPTFGGEGVSPNGVVAEIVKMPSDGVREKPDPHVDRTASASRIARSCITRSATCR
jgi:hypothetical protein